MGLSYLRAFAIALLVSATFSCGGALPGDSGGDNLPHETALGFMPGVEFATDSPGMDLLAADVDANGRPDLFVPLLGGGLKVVPNFSTPGMIDFDGGRPSEATERSLLDAAVADYNADERADLILLDNGGFLEIRLQDELGLFDLFARYLTEFSFYEPVFGCSQLCMDQINSSDTTLDILFAADLDNDIRAIYQVPDDGGVYHEDGIPGSIPAPGWRDKPSSSSYTDMNLVDFEGNGLNDLILADELDHSLQVFTHIECPLGEYVHNPETGEIELPQPDVFYGYQAVFYYYSKCDLPAPGPLDDPHPAAPKRLSTGDIDHDGIVDVAVLCSYFGGIPEGPWYTTASSQILEVPVTMIWLLKTTIEEYDALYDWTTDNTVPRTAVLEAMTGLTFPNFINDIKLVDVDGDDELDVLGCCDGSGSGGYSFFYFPGLGDFQFAAPVGFDLIAPPMRLVAEDFDGDDYIDVAVLLPTLNAVSIFRNDAEDGLGASGVEYVFFEY